MVCFVVLGMWSRSGIVVLSPKFALFAGLGVGAKVRNFLRKKKIKYNSTCLAKLGVNHYMQFILIPDSHTVMAACNIKFIDDCNKRVAKISDR